MQALFGDLVMADVIRGWACSGGVFLIYSYSVGGVRPKQRL